MKYLKLMQGIPISSASRNKREIAVASEYGYGVTVIYSENKNIYDDNMDKYILINWPSPELTYEILRLKRYFIIIRERLRLILYIKDFDVISCHNLSMLRCAYLSVILRFRKNKTKLIYDSHEYELESRGKRGRLKSWWIKKEEKYLIKKCAFSVMVNNSIAREVKKIHNLDISPVVVRSIPPNWKLDYNLINEVRKSLCYSYNISESSFLCMYHGNIVSNRGVEQLIKAVAYNPNIFLIILGYVKSTRYIQSLYKLIEENNVGGRVFFHDAVPIDMLWQYVGAVDVGTIIIPNYCKSYYLSLPNKLFENIQSLTPVVCSNFPEMKNIVDKYNIGLTCDPDSPTAISKTIETLRTDRKLYKAIKKNLLAAKEDLCWEKEKEALITAYQKYL